MHFFRGSPNKEKNHPEMDVVDEETAAAHDKLKAESGDNTNNGGDKKKVVKDLTYYKTQAEDEKAGKRKLFHALVKLADELKRVKKDAAKPLNENTEYIRMMEELKRTKPLQDNADYANQTWYEGGLWRAPTVLPAVQHGQVSNQRARQRAAVSLSDLFFNLVIVTAFTRVGLAVTNTGQVTASSFLYFAVFWTIWSKEASYSTRFDTTDLSAKASTLVTCFFVLFMSLSASTDMKSLGGSRIMAMAAGCSMLNCGLMARVFWWHRMPENTLDRHVQKYALYNTVMNFLETTVWIFGMVLVPVTQRYIVFTVAILLGLRIPRAFLANDFHAACTKRGVLFILLLGFMLQSVVVIATDFFDYTSPNWEQYSFIGASCLLLFCIKLLYVEDSSTKASDHALLVNRAAALCFNLGQFALLFSTTIMGSGLNLLTHSYLAAAAALPGSEKSLVCGGFSAVLLSTMFIKSMHLKRVPVANPQKSMFIGAYVIQTLATLAIAGITGAMAFGQAGYMQVLMHDDVELMWVLSGFALFLVVLSWLDEGLELALQDDEVSGNDYLVHPFGFWWCLKPEVSMDEILVADAEEGAHHAATLGMQRDHRTSHARLSELSPLLGESVANMRLSMMVDSRDSLFGLDPSNRV